MAFLDSKYNHVVPYSKSNRIRYYNAFPKGPYKYKSTFVVDNKLDGNGWFYMKNSGDSKALLLLENRDALGSDLKPADRGSVYQVGKFVK